jgi:hypothetical protein
MRNLIKELFFHFALLVTFVSGFSSPAISSPPNQPPILGTYDCYRRQNQVMMQNELQYNIVTQTQEWRMMPRTTLTFVPEPYKLHLKKGNFYSFSVIKSSGTYQFKNSGVVFSGDINKFNLTEYIGKNGDYIFIFQPSAKLFIQCEIVTGTIPTSNLALSKKTGPATGNHILELAG